MKLSFSHPYKENLSINLGQFTQVVGQNQQLKYYIWQLLVWYFNGKKYSEEDLNIFNQAEPEISTEATILKRNFFDIISISDVQDLTEQMVYKKGTVAFDFMKISLNSVDIINEIDDINDKLDKISLLINDKINLIVGDTCYHTESIYLTIEQLLAKNFTPYFNVLHQNISFEFVDNETKVLIFLEMIEQKLTTHTDHLLLVFRNMDDYLNYSSFVRICQKISNLCDKYPYFYCMIFPSNEGYLYVTKENVEHINIVSDFVEQLYEFRFMYQRFLEQYPSNESPDEDEFLKILQRNSSYLFTQEIEHVSLGVSDLVAIKILNTLYHYDKKLNYTIPMTNPLELHFLQDKN